MSSGRFPSLGFDPAPGDQSVAAQVADSVGHTAQALDEIAALLTGAADGEWRGKAAIAFRHMLDHDFRPKVVTAAQSFDASQRALQDWLWTMRDSQSRAAGLERQHADAVQAARSAHAALAALPASAVPAGGPPPTPDQLRAEQDLADRRAAASGRANSADAEVRRLHDAAVQLAQSYERAGRDAANRLQHAMDLAPDEPGFWQRLADDVGKVLDDIGHFAADIRDRMVDLLEQVAPLLQVIGDVAGLLSAALGLLAFVPGLQFLAIPALVLGGVALLSHYGAAVGRTGSFTKALTDKDVVMDAIGVVLGVGALKVGAKLVAAARAGSTAEGGGSAVRAVPQLVGPDMEMPASYFQLATTNYSMGQDELIWRTVSYHVTAAGLVGTTVGAGGNVSTISELAHWNFGPLTRRPQVVG